MGGLVVDGGGGRAPEGATREREPSVFRPVTTKVRNPAAAQRPARRPTAGAKCAPHNVNTRWAHIQTHNAGAHSAELAQRQPQPSAIDRTSQPLVPVFVVVVGFGFGFARFGHQREIASATKRAHTTRAQRNKPPDERHHFSIGSLWNTTNQPASARQPRRPHTPAVLPLLSVCLRLLSAAEEEEETKEGKKQNHRRLFQSHPHR